MEQKTIHLNTTEKDPHDRTRRFFGDTFCKLQKLKVLVIGAGAVGNEVIKNLAMLGIGNIFLVDFDKVMASNLNRCIFFRIEDHNQTQKVEAISREVKIRYPNTRILPFNTPIQEAPEEVWQVPLVMVAVDNNEARYYINLKVLSLPSIPFVINGAMGRTFAEIQVLLPGDTACMVCSWSENYTQKLFARMVRENCDAFFYKTVEHFPAISIVSSLVGSIMASEAIKILAGLDNWHKQKTWQEDLIPVLGNAIRYDIRNHQSSCGKVYPNPKCVEVFCRKKRKIKKLESRL